MVPVILNMLYLNLLMNMSGQPTMEKERRNNSDEGDCYNVYGTEVCFPSESYLISGSQPIPESPSTPKEIGTTFNFYSKDNQSYPQILDPSSLFSLANAPINRNKSVIIISHGYLSSGQTPWIKKLVAELFRADEENVIVVDWSKGCRPPYVQAVANIRMVGVQLAQLIFSLVRYADIAISSFYLVGHSLGAHLVGHCGRYLRDVYGLVLPRITGLDPAGPIFADANPVARLDPTDAKFVDVIHTDNSPLLGLPFTIGMKKTVGHLDFYPNGGNIQPACNGNTICRHHRASELFIESIRQSCTFMGVVCSSYEAFLQGECWGCHDFPCSPMGRKAKPLLMDTTSKKFFLITNGESPYCGSHYRVTLSSSNETMEYGYTGEFAVIAVELIGGRVSSGEISLSEKSVFYKTGSTYRRVILANDVGDLQSISLSFHYPGSLLNPMSWRIKGPYLHFHSVTVDQLYPEKSWTYCFKDTHLKLNMKYKLNKKNAC